MWSDFLDTIVARATPLGSGGVCIVRLSGPDAVQIGERLFVRDRGSCLSKARPRHLVTGTITVAGNPIDRGLAVWFRAPQSYTGEDVVELHLHGNMMIAELVIEGAIAAGARVATPGEFTRRAFVHGRMDLTQVESLADLLSVESRQALAAAEHGLRGALRSQLSELRERLLSLLGLLELELDFVEEGYQFSSPETIRGLLVDVGSFARDLLDQYDRGELLRRHPRVLLLGKPNAGKSSFLNCAVGYGRALVSEEAGTTRDYIEEPLVVDGIRMSLIDSAGLRGTSETLEYAGIVQTLDLVDRVDALIVLVDSTIGDVDDEVRQGRELQRRFDGVPSLLVLSKVDHRDSRPDPSVPAVPESSLEGPLHRCSIRRPESIREVLHHCVRGFRTSTTGVSFLVTARQKAHLQAIIATVEHILSLNLQDSEVVSAELRQVLAPLSELSGATISEDVLNTIFSSFCVGK